MMISPLMGFWSFRFTGPTLPAFYSEYTSQEARLMEISKIINRSIKWNELALEKINEISEIVNAGTDTDVADLLARMAAVEQDVQALENLNAELEQRLNDNFTALSELETSTEENTTAINAVERDITALETSVGTISTRVSAVENSVNSAIIDIDALTVRVNAQDTRLNGVDTTISGISTDVDTVTTEVNELSTVVDDHGARITVVEDELANGGGGGGGTDYGDVKVVKNSEFKPSILTELTGVVLSQDKENLNGAGDETTTSSFYFTSTDDSVAFATGDIQEDFAFGFDISVPAVSSLRTDIESNETRLTTVEDTVSTQNTNFESFKTETNSAFSQVNSRVDTAEASISSVSDSLNTVGIQVDEHSTEIADLSTDVVNNTTNIASIDSKVADYGTVKSNVSSNTSRIVTLENSSGSNAGTLKYFPGIGYATGSAVGVEGAYISSIDRSWLANSPSSNVRITESTTTFSSTNLGTGNTLQIFGLTANNTTIVSLPAFPFSEISQNQLFSGSFQGNVISGGRRWFPAGNNQNGNALVWWGWETIGNNIILKTDLLNANNPYVVRDSVSFTSVSNGLEISIPIKKTITGTQPSLNKITEIKGELKIGADNILPSSIVWKVDYTTDSNNILLKGFILNSTTEETLNLSSFNRLYIGVATPRVV